MAPAPLTKILGDSNKNSWGMESAKDLPKGKGIVMNGGQRYCENTILENLGNLCLNVNHFIVKSFLTIITYISENFRVFVFKC